MGSTALGLVLAVAASVVAAPPGRAFPDAAEAIGVSFPLSPQGLQLVLERYELDGSSDLKHLPHSSKRVGLVTHGALSITSAGENLSITSTYRKGDAFVIPLAPHTIKSNDGLQTEFVVLQIAE